uniref:Retrotransposon protein, putative, Ty1-copia subclass n=1 Tax=Tanacetum cinerariifolium TaxID=118510 RepID=A0A6L2JJ61_TANCI|nr:retrotransposon protein, putative, Ty1-copia subclass [Tanacetum cinerariifolium]
MWNLDGPSLLEILVPRFLSMYLERGYARCNLDRKSTSGGCQILDRKLVCWSAKKQSSVARSSAEAIYVAAAGRCAQISATSFKKPYALEVPLTSHTLKVAKLSLLPEESLIHPSGGVNDDDTVDKSLLGTSMQLDNHPKAPTDKKKKNPASSKPKTSKIVRESSSIIQVADNQHAEEPMATADTTKSIDASEKVREIGHQLKPPDAKKVHKSIVEEVVKEPEIASLGKVDPKFNDDDDDQGAGSLFIDQALEKQLLSVSLLICLGKCKYCRKDTIAGTTTAAIIHHHHRDSAAATTSTPSISSPTITSKPPPCCHSTSIEHHPHHADNLTIIYIHQPTASPRHHRPHLTTTKGAFGFAQPPNGCIFLITAPRQPRFGVVGFKQIATRVHLVFISQISRLPRIESRDGISKGVAGTTTAAIIHHHHRDFATATTSIPSISSPTTTSQPPHHSHHLAATLPPPSTTPTTPTNSPSSTSTSPHHHHVIIVPTHSPPKMPPKVRWFVYSVSTDKGAFGCGSSRDLVRIEAKSENMIEEYNHCINFMDDPVPITKFSYRVNNSNKESTMRFIRNNQPLNLMVATQTGKFGIPSLPQLIAFEFPSAEKTSDKKRKRMTKLIHEVFVKENIVVDGMQRNLTLPQRVVRKASMSSASKGGLTECKASMSNLRRIQVRDIVKEVKDYLNTYSSAGMDINCQLVPSVRLYKFACKLDTLLSLLVQRHRWENDPGKLGAAPDSLRGKQPATKPEDENENEGRSTTHAGAVSFATLLKGEPSRKSVNFRTLLASAGNRADVAISLESVRVVHERLSNNVYGFRLLEIWVLKFNLIPLKRFINLSLIRMVLARGEKKQVGLTEQEVRNSNPFDALNTVENDDELRTNEGNSTLVEKGVNSYVVSSVHETSYEAFGFMTSTNFEVNKSCSGVRNKSLYEQWKETYNENPYDDDDFDNFGLNDAEMKFTNEFDISLLLFGHVQNGCLKKIVSDVLKNLKNPRRVVKGLYVGPNLGSKVLFNSTKKVYQLVSKKNVENDDEMGTNEGNSNSVEKGVNSYVVSVHETSYEAFGSPNTTHLATRINDLKRQMLDKKRVLVDDDGKPLKRLMIRLVHIVIVKWTRCLMKLQLTLLIGPNFIDWYRQLRIVLSIEDKLIYLEQLISLALVAPEGQQVAPKIIATHTAWIKGSKEISELMPMTMKPEIQRNLENRHAHEIMGKTINELHAMLKLHEQTLPKDNAPALHAIRAGKVQKGNKQHKKPQSQMPDMGQNQRNGKNKLSYALKPKIPPPPKRKDPAKESVCHQRGDTCHWKRNCPYNKRSKPNLDSALLWRFCLGHSSKKRIEKLQYDGLLNTSDLRAFEKCVPCMCGNMAREPYTHQVERAKDLLRLIHADVCGPFKIMSRQGASYFVTFTDDFSHYGYVYLLKHKHEVFKTFKVFQKEVENQLGKTIKSLRFDCGGEYMSQEFLDHLKDHGIIAHLNPPYTPQHNGVSERRNKTLLDMVRSMMSQTTLPKSFWDYALETVARILNMVPTKKVKKTPYEVHKDTTSPDRMCLYIDAEEHDLGDHGEPANYKAALLDHESDKCLNTMNVEMQSMKDNKKTDMDGAVHTYKARLVTNGYTQTPRIDYEETFSSVADIRAIRILIAIAAFMTMRFGKRMSKLPSSMDTSPKRFTWSNLKTNADDLKSQTGYVFVLNGGVVDWKSAKQSIFATSSA